ncbi:MAG: hypothetical protein JW795_23855 [Chitinivibrionales bacterium]|nr:hypothetical protein [Chitinivibrionales bacterium]
MESGFNESLSVALKQIFNEKQIIVQNKRGIYSALESYEKIGDCRKKITAGAKNFFKTHLLGF